MVNRVAMLSPKAIHSPIPNQRLSRMGQCFIAVLLIIVFEGAFRKWISSDLTNPIVLLRDVLVLYSVFWALHTRRLRFSRVSAQVLLVWTSAVLIWGLVQLIAEESSLTIFLIGLRFWLLYLWFAYAAAVSLTDYDFFYVAKTLQVLLVLMTPLAIGQFFLSPGAFLNQQVGGDETSVFRVTADIVRTTGTFSFTAGYSTFLAVVTPFVLANLNPGVRFWKRKWMSMACLFALGVATIVSGSRGAILFFGVSFLVFSVLALFFFNHARKGRTLNLIAGVSIILVGIFYSFSRAVDALQERFQSAAQSEILSARVFRMFFGEPDAYTNATFIGHGIGLGTNFAGSLATGRRTFLLAETEVARTILEGGWLGFIFIGLKVFVIIIGLRQSLNIVRRNGNSLPLLLWFTTGLALLSWSIIGQLTINALGYMLLGLAIAALRNKGQRLG